MEIIFIILGVVVLIQIISMFVKDAAGTCTLCNGTGRNRYNGERCMSCLGTGSSKTVKNMISPHKNKEHSSYLQSTNQQQPSGNQSQKLSNRWVTDMVNAIDESKVDIVKQLIAQGADVNHVEISMSPTGKAQKRLFLSSASVMGNYEIVKLLLDNGANVNAKSHLGTTALMSANRAKIAELLIESGANINEQDEVGYTALMGLCDGPDRDKEVGNEEIAKFLIEKGCNIHAIGTMGQKILWLTGEVRDTGDYGWNALMLASKNGRYNTVKMLLERGADINATSQRGYTALSIALQNNYVEIANLLKGNSIKTGTEDPEFAAMEKLKKMFDASLITKEDYDAKKREVLDGLSLGKSIKNTSLPSPTEEEKSGSATANNIKDEEEQVTEISTNDNVMDSNNIKLFFLASKNGDKSVIHSLLDKGVDLNAKDRNGNTALILASSNGHKEIAKILIENKADITIKNSIGMTALDLALQNKHVYIAQLLDV
jgi:ankyrin repeat protein